MDGRILVAGGTFAFPGEVPGEHHPHFPGLRDTTTYDPVTRGWVRTATMATEPGKRTGGGRWYPTLLTLPSGQVLAVSGHPLPDDTRHTNDSPEAFTSTPVPTGAWRLLTKADPAHAVGYYPRLHVLPGGDVLYATPVAGRTIRFHPDAATYSDVCPGPPDGLYGGIQSTSVLLPLRPSDGYRARVLVTGAHQPYRLDLGAPAAGWKATKPRALAGSPLRQNGCAVLLPTGQVLCVGGVVDPANDASAVRAAELYDPGTDTWSVLASAAVTRNYHSVALLMPDGRVWTAGSNKNAKRSFPTPGVDNRELRIELFEPPYYSATRPQLTRTQASLGWGRRFDLLTPDPAGVVRVALMRAGAVTHAYDSDQRYVELASEPTVGAVGAVTAWAPPSPDIAPPGYYLAFLIDAAGVPSVGQFVRLAPAASSSGMLIQSNLGRRGDLEVVVPHPQGGLQHWRRDNDDPGLPWQGPQRFAQPSGAFEGVSLIQSTFGVPGNLEAVGRVGSRLFHVWRESDGALTWRGPVPVGDGATSNPALIQSVLGSRGNFELVVGRAGGGLAHYWRNNDQSGLPWKGPAVVSADVGAVEAVAMVQSNFGSTGNLEVVARVGDVLHFFYRAGPPWVWHHGGIIARGVRGVPAMIQSRLGTRGNFELVVPSAGGGLTHYWRNNDIAGFPWRATASFGGSDLYDEVSLIQSNFGSPLLGELEVVARAGGETRMFSRTDGPPWSWSAVPAPSLL
ncbi:MAG TPA: galactose oxidase-like domain-containing protein [Mycobacteriales bacterium]|nr:galactose oxidase-like domain-containing protein [Mycobacteriales bacterium]